VKVICPSWNVSFSNSNHYNISATFERVYEP
jgi:phage-related protein